MSEVIAREFNNRWKHANWKMITADGIQSDMPKVVESVLVNVYGNVISVPIFVAESVSKQVILCHTWKPYPGQWQSNPDDGRCEITIPVVA